MNQYVGTCGVYFFNNYCIHFNAQVLNLDRLASAVEAHHPLWVQSRLAWCHLWCLAWCHLESGKPKVEMGGVRDLPKEKKNSTTDSNLLSLFYVFFCDVEVLGVCSSFFLYWMFMTHFLFTRCRDDFRPYSISYFSKKQVPYSEPSLHIILTSPGIFSCWQPKNP